jgi:hypothetical protein
VQTPRLRDFATSADVAVSVTSPDDNTNVAAILNNKRADHVRGRRPRRSAPARPGAALFASASSRSSRATCIASSSGPASVSQFNVLIDESPTDFLNLYFAIPTSDTFGGPNNRPSKRMHDAARFRHETTFDCETTKIPPSHPNATETTDGRHR